MSRRSHALALTLALAAPRALADPPPKVCVVVAGDPDEALRSAADTLDGALGLRSDLRTVADPAARAALHGERSTDPSVSDLADRRRLLRGTDADLPLLAPLGDRLGCAWVVELQGRASGLHLHTADLVRSQWREDHTVPNPDAASLVAFVLADVLSAPSPTDTHSTTPRAGTPSAPVRRTFWQRAWPWMVVGGAALVVVGVFFLTQDEPPGSVRLTVVHGGLR
ncbi:MAG: hypothetical protein HY909_07515 [Deltaproteobacteria bacterium]|nr:hypothetical protein [Deltaproteobacteria bacterium]